MIVSDVKREGVYTRPDRASAGCLAVINTNGRHRVDLTMFIRPEGTRNQRPPSALYTSTMSDGTVHTKCM